MAGMQAANIEDLPEEMQGHPSPHGSYTGKGVFPLVITFTAGVQTDDERVSRAGAIVYHRGRQARVYPVPCGRASGECAKNGDGRNRTRVRSRSKLLSFTLWVADGRLEGEALDGEQRYILRATRLVD